MPECQATKPLVNFSEIDDYDEKWSPEQLEAAGFLHKLDWEGGISGLLYYNVQEFPEELQDLAAKALDHLDQLGAAVNKWAADRGVSY